MIEAPGITMPRQSYYGEGQQAIDIIVAQGWGPDFAAGNVLKYLRRAKENPEQDLEKARWYLELLKFLAANRRYAKESIRKLQEEILTPEEYSLLTKTE